jgi:protein-disulfide isomerase
MDKKELESLEYLIKKFRDAKDKKPIFSEALRTMEERREALVGAQETPKSDPSKPPQIGGDDAPVTIVEFMDFECPPCKMAGKTIKKILETYPDKVRLIFRNFPKVEKHPFAVRAAEAALCAHEQGKFWEYYKLLFENQRKLDEDALIRFGREIGLDMEGFQGCLLLNEAAKRVMADMELGLELGVRKVPTFFINGRKIEGRKSLNMIEEIIKEELE